MNILFIDNNPTHNIFWEDLMPMLFPQSTQQFCTLDNWEAVFNSNKREMVIFFSSSIKEEVEKIADRCKSEKVSFLCVVDDYTIKEFQLLLDNNVQGLIQTSTTSLKEIKEIIDLIMNGGFYLKAPSKELVQANPYIIVALK